MTVAARTVATLGERDLIARIRARLPGPPAWMVVGIGDDAAVVEPERNQLEVLTVDALVEGIHFDRAFTPPDAIGHRALAVNLSDLAAMGASPRLALLSLAFPSDLPLDDFDGIIGGITALAARYRVHIAGGNLAQSPGPIVLDITAIGSVKRRGALLRSGARPGDELYVTGTVGTAAAGLEILQTAAGLATDDHRLATDDRRLLTTRFLFPDPRVRAGLLVGRNRAASACMDLSDGLADAVRQVAEASGVGAVVEADAVPLEPPARDWFARSGRDPVEAAIAGGDDYELLFAVLPRMRRRFLAAIGGAAKVTRIGACTAEPVVLLRGAGRPDRPLPSGYVHFR